MQIVFNIGLSFFLYCLVGLSFVVIYGPCGFFNLVHAVTLTFAAYFSYLFSQQAGLTLWMAVPLSIACATCAGLLTEITVFDPLRRRAASPMMMMIASLGFYSVLQNCISMIWGDDTKSIRDDEIKVGHEFFGARVTDTQIITIVICVVLFLTCVLFIKHSRVGRNIRAVASNPRLSNILGISSGRAIIWAVCIGSALASVAGILIAFDTDMTPTMGFRWLLYGVVAMVIGGVGSIWGLVGGALLLATAQHLAAYYVGGQWMDAVSYVVLILLLMVRPLGFSGRRLKKVEV